MDLCCCERSFSISLIATMGATVPHGKQASLGCSGSAVEVPGLSLREACGIFPDQGLNLCPLLWQVDRSTGPPGRALHFWLSGKHCAGQDSPPRKRLPVARVQNHSPGSQDSIPAETLAFSSFKLTPGNQDAVYNSVETHVHICGRVCVLMSKKLEWLGMEVKSRNGVCWWLGLSWLGF